MTNIRLRLTFAAVLWLTTLLIATGCRDRQPESSSPDAAPTGPWIKADPNPVTVPADSKGKTTISWDTRDGSDAQVYLRFSGKEDQLFSGGGRYQAEANWIGKGVTYEFILFAGKDHQKELARVLVKGVK